jgi:hypothetical protein
MAEGEEKLSDFQSPSREMENAEMPVFSRGFECFLMP